MQEEAEKAGGFGLFSSTKLPEKDEGFIFVIKTSKRDYRMQAVTKQDQKMWLRALNILFELRARVSQNLKTTIDINSHLGIEATIAATIGTGKPMDPMKNRRKPKSVASKFNSKMSENLKQFEKEHTQDKKDLLDEA